MPVHYFHVRSGSRVELDTYGTDCADLAAAKRHAQGLAAAADRAPDEGPDGWRIEIADAGGQYLASVDRDGVVAD